MPLLNNAWGVCSKLIRELGCHSHLDQTTVHVCERLSVGVCVPEEEEEKKKANGRKTGNADRQQKEHEPQDKRRGTSKYDTVCKSDIYSEYP